MLLDVLTLHYGIVSLVAKGVKSGRSGLQSVLQPFRALVISWSGKGELPLLVKAEEAGAGAGLDRENIINGFYLNELLLRFLHRGDPHPGIFESYVAALSVIKERGDIQQGLRIYEKRLLDELGYGLVLDHDVETGSPIEQGKKYSYLIEAGPVPYVEGRQEDITIHGESLISLAHGELCGKRVMHEVRNLMRTIIQHHLGDIPVRSREVLLSQQRT
jgi:DNA repair protein RecO (recombination protein O)